MSNLLHTRPGSAQVRVSLRHHMRVSTRQDVHSTFPLFSAHSTALGRARSRFANQFHPFWFFPFPSTMSEERFWVILDPLCFCLSIVTGQLDSWTAKTFPLLDWRLTSMLNGRLPYHCSARPAKRRRKTGMVGVFKQKFRFEYERRLWDVIPWMAELARLIHGPADWKPPLTRWSFHEYSSFRGSREVRSRRPGPPTAQKGGGRYERNEKTEDRTVRNGGLRKEGNGERMKECPEREREKKT